jgi:hypothetical protein
VDDVGTHNRFAQQLQFVVYVTRRTYYATNIMWKKPTFLWIYDAWLWITRGVLICLRALSPQWANLGRKIFPRALEIYFL